MARILIIEDEANNLDVARRIVRGAGHEALTATDGLLGLEIARREHPDAVLVDLLLPKLDGWSVTRAIREEPWAKTIPIIAVSALAMQADRERAREAGCDDFVTKPYAPAELRVLLGKYFIDGSAPKAATRASEPSASGISPAERLGRVLVVDDEPSNVELIVRRLGGNGYETLTASNGHDAIAIATKEQPDLILMDIMMPGLDGWQATRLLKGDPKTANIPVVFVTARDRPEDVAQGFEAGGIMYVNKPVEPVELFARVRNAIYMKRLQDDLRNKNEDLKRLESSRQELIGMLGHDIRNLANSVVAFLQLARMGELTPDRPEFAQLLGLSEANIAEVLRMVNALLDVYKMEEGRLEAVAGVNKLADVVKRSFAQLIPEAMAKGIALVERIPEDTTVFIDAGLIVRVLTNLVSNAIKHTPGGGSVTIDAEPSSADSIVVRVTDTGPGIPEADAAHVFDRFYQTDTGRSRGGTGLGLAFCKLAVELHGGKIGVANGGQPGAVVEFTIPSAARVPAAEPVTA
ncbi:MAG TPA: response regulator [Candidatus Saccharimonadales bacterium]|jgi:two-component system sensor histidine kinase/response regulator|nr:response regulator [Candidatus Saccharimonadales bacterium]